MFSERLRNHIEDYFVNRGEDLTSMALPEFPEPGEGDAFTFLKTVNILINSFGDLESSEMLALRMKLLTDPSLKDYGWVEDGLAYRLEVMLRAIASGELEISFYDPSEVLLDPDQDPGGMHTLCLSYMAQEGSPVKLSFIFPPAMTIEALNDEAKKRELFAHVVSLSWLASEVHDDPNRFAFSTTAEKWRIADGPTGLLAVGVNSRNAFNKLMENGAWEGWKSL